MNFKIGKLIHLQKWVNLFAGYVLWLMMVYLTDVWELNIVHAAAIINIWMGLIRILPIVFAYLADAFLGNSIIILFSSFSTMIGLGLIWMSTPPVLGKSNGNCTQYKPECIGEQQKQLFYSGLVFTGLGMASLSACYGPFEQQAAEEANSGKRNSGWYRNHLVALAALIVATFVKSWAILFGICAIFGVVSFFVCLFLRVISGFSDPVTRPQGSPLTTIFRVLFAASTKFFHERPQNMSELYDIPADPLQEELLPHTKGLRCLDHAAIIKADLTLEQQASKRWSLCKVAEVEETKIFIRTIPIWMTFIICGVVSSLGATYFLEQANTLNRKVGKAKTPLILFFWFYDHFRKSFTDRLIPQFAQSRQHTAKIGMALALVYGTLACITAAKIETRRLGVVRSHGLIDKPDERVPMTIFWLLFQFVLLGWHDGSHRLGAYAFSLDRAPKSMAKYFTLFARAFFGLGVVGSVLVVYVVGEISEGRTGTNWFQSTLNTSRLDNYYWVLAASSAINFAIFLVLACFYHNRKSSNPDSSKLIIPAGFMDDDHI